MPKLDQDDWSRDPAVQQMRTVFADMERIQEIFLVKTGISAFDPRLRSIRETARSRFEEAWACAAGKAMVLEPETLAALYAAGFYHALQAAGLSPPRDLRPDDPMLLDLLREAS